MRELSPAVFEFETIRISDGLGFGEGAISGEADPHVLALADEAIRSDDILVPISRDEHGNIIEDDGCGDGRSVKLIFRLKQFFNRSLNRAKVFGGAVAMTAASLIGAGQADGSSVGETFSSAIKLLNERNMDYGAHTDEHASGENSGCGAIDNAPKIIRSAVKYESQIRAVIDVLGADTSELNTVYKNFYDYVDKLPAAEDYSGRRVMGKIMRAGKFVKQLAGKHHEKYILLNAVRDYTVDQELVRRATNGRAQVFAVDIWRMEDIASGLNPHDTTAESQTYLSELIYTLATSAVLTKGDLPVYLIK